MINKNLSIIFFILRIILNDVRSSIISGLKSSVLFITLISLFSCEQSAPESTVTNKTSSPVPSSDTVPKNKAPIYVYYLGEKLYASKEINYPTNYMDSVKLECSAKFRKIKDDEKHSAEDGLTFTLKVTNSGSIPILEVQSARVTSKLRVYINGDGDACFMTLANCSTPVDGKGNLKANLIAPGLNDSFDMGYQITDNHDKIFTYQWEYMEKKSKILEVNTIKKTIKVVAKHREAPQLK